MSVRSELFTSTLAGALDYVAWQDESGKYNWNIGAELADTAEYGSDPPSVYGCLAGGDFYHGNGPLEDAWEVANNVIAKFDEDLIGQAMIIIQGLNTALAFMEETANFARSWVFTRSYSYPRGENFAYDAYELSSNVDLGDIAIIDAMVLLADEFLSWS